MKRTVFIGFNNNTEITNNRSNYVGKYIHVASISQSLPYIVTVYSLKDSEGASAYNKRLVDKFIVENLEYNTAGFFNNLNQLFINRLLGDNDLLVVAKRKDITEGNPHNIAQIDIFIKLLGTNAIVDIEYPEKVTFNTNPPIIISPFLVRTKPWTIEDINEGYVTSINSQYNLAKKEGVTNSLPDNVQSGTPFYNKTESRLYVFSDNTFKDIDGSKSYYWGNAKGVLKIDTNDKPCLLNLDFYGTNTAFYIHKSGTAYFIKRVSGNQLKFETHFKFYKDTDNNLYVETCITYGRIKLIPLSGICNLEVASPSNVSYVSIIGLNNYPEPTSNSSILLSPSMTTEERSALNMTNNGYIGLPIFDKTLNKHLWWTGDSSVGDLGWSDFKGTKTYKNSNANTTVKLVIPNGTFLLNLNISGITTTFLIDICNSNICIRRLSKDATLKFETHYKFLTDNTNLYMLLAIANTTITLVPLTGNTCNIVEENVTGTVSYADVIGVIGHIEPTTSGKSIITNTVMSKTTREALVMDVKYSGVMVFDTTLKKPVWYNGTDWIDATGTPV